MTKNDLRGSAALAAVLLAASFALTGCVLLPVESSAPSPAETEVDDVADEAPAEDETDEDVSEPTGSGCPDGLIDSMVDFGASFGIEFVELTPEQFDAPQIGDDLLVASCLYSVESEASFSHSAAVPGLVRDEIIQNLLAAGYQESDIVDGQYFLDGVGTRLELDEFASGADSDFAFGMDSANFYNDGFVAVTVFPKE
jgi:hypothetical protein